MAKKCAYLFYFTFVFSSCDNTLTLMKVLANQDFLEVRLASLIADYDRDTLSNLYQPMIGYEALALYMTLWSEANNERISPLCTHEQVFLRMRIPAGAYVEARKYLEATGLLKTFVSQGQDFKIYHYELYAPKSPRGFFDDALLYGMLIKSIGESNANRLKTIYLVDPKRDYGEEITTKFAEMFHPEFNDNAFLEAASEENKTKGRNSGKIKGAFSYEKFFIELGNISQIKDSAFNNVEMKEVERLATLNGVDEEETAKLVNQLYDPEKRKGQRIDFDKLSKAMQEKTDYKYRRPGRAPQSGPNLMSGQTDLARKINLMEQKAPKDYLSYLQGGTKPASADLKVINDLSKNYHLPNPVINAVVDYVLYKADNVLSRPYAEKVAVSLVRENILTAVDAMNYLKKVDKKSRNKKTNKTFVKVLETEHKDNDEKNKDWESDWDKFLEEINGGEDGGKA